MFTGVIPKLSPQPSHEQAEVDTSAVPATGEKLRHGEEGIGRLSLVQALLLSTLLPPRAKHNSPLRPLVHVPWRPVLGTAQGLYPLC